MTPLPPSSPRASGTPRTSRSRAGAAPVRCRGTAAAGSGRAAGRTCCRRSAGNRHRIRTAATPGARHPLPARRGEVEHGCVRVVRDVDPDIQRAIHAGSGLMERSSRMKLVVGPSICPRPDDRHDRLPPRPPPRFFEAVDAIGGEADPRAELRLRKAQPLPERVQRSVQRTGSSRSQCSRERASCVRIAWSTHRHVSASAGCQSNAYSESNSLHARNTVSKRSTVPSFTRHVTGWLLRHPSRHAGIVW